MSERDGGPVAPCKIEQSCRRPSGDGGTQLRETIEWRGMSVRQFYKAHALALLVKSTLPDGSRTATNIAAAAAELADAMLAEDTAHAHEQSEQAGERKKGEG